MQSFLINQVAGFKNTYFLNKPFVKQTQMHMKLSSSTAKLNLDWNALRVW